MQNVSNDCVAPTGDADDSIVAAVSFVRSAAARLDSFLEQTSYSQLGGQDAVSIDSELRHLGDSEEELRRELDNLRLELLNASSDKICYDHDDSKTSHRTKGADFKVDTEVPELVMSSPLSNMDSANLSRDVPTIPDLQSPKRRGSRFSRTSSLRSLESDRLLSAEKVESLKDNFVERVARIAYGKHEHKVQPIFSLGRDDKCVRTIQGEASVAMATAIATVALSKPLLGSDCSFPLVLACVPALVTCAEIHLPHRMEETNIALVILVISYVLQQFM